MRLSEFLSRVFVASTEVNEGLQHSRCGVAVAVVTPTQSHHPPSPSRDILPPSPVRLVKGTETFRVTHVMGKEHKEPRRRTDELVIPSLDGQSGIPQVIFVFSGLYSYSVKMRLSEKYFKTGISCIKFWIFSSS